MKTTAQRIQETRLMRKKTKSELARAVGVHRDTIANYESGHTRNIPLDKLEKIAEFLNVGISSLLGTPESLDRSALVLSIDEQFLIEEYRKLNAIDQETVRCLCRRLFEAEQCNPKLIQLHL